MPRPRLSAILARMPMQPDELGPITQSALNLLGVAIEAEQAEVIQCAERALRDIARLRRDLVQGAATAAYPRRAAIYASLLDAAPLIAGWEVLDDEGKTYRVAGMDYRAFASEDEATRFRDVVLQELGKIVVPHARPAGSLVYWLG